MSLIGLIFPIVTGSIRIQDDQGDLLKGGSCEQELPAEWTSNGLKLTLGSSGQKKKLRKFLKVEPLDPKTPGALSVKSTGMIHLGDSVYFRGWVRDAGTAESLTEVQVEVVGTDSGKKPLIDRK